MDFVANFMENTTVKKFKMGQHLSAKACGVVELVD